jgi:hypothetical protein
MLWVSLSFWLRTSLPLHHDRQGAAYKLLSEVDRARRTRHLAANAMCTFQALTTEDSKTPGLLAQPDIVIPGRQGSFRGSNADPSASRPSASESNEVDFGQYVDEVSHSSLHCI